MFISKECLDRIRNHFTVAEKGLINDCITGEIICPRGISVNIHKLPSPLRDKLRGKIDEYEGSK